MIKPQENVFETGSRRLIPSTLIYVRHQGKVLMIHRSSADSRWLDFHEGKWNGLGGKCEKDESPLMAAQRELQEESGLNIPLAQFRSAGVIQFPLFKPHKNEDWLVFLFSVDLEELPSTGLLKETKEGVLHWISDSDILNLNLWPGDLLFLPYVLQRKAFIGTIWYEDSRVKNSWFQLIK